MMLKKYLNGSGNNNYKGKNLFLFYSSGFMADNPEGTLTKGKMMDMYCAILTIKKATIFVDQISTKFDTDNNGTIDFKVTLTPNPNYGFHYLMCVQEFMLSTNVSEANSSEEKLRWALRMHDTDSSGKVD